MAIEEFGKSLLADVRKRKDDQARAMAKQEEKNAWAALGANVLIKGAESYMKENTKDFLYNQNIYTARQQQQRALNHQKNLYKIQGDIESQGVSDEMYFEKLIRPELEAQLALQVEGYKPGEVTKYDQLIAQQARELAKERASQYREALGMAQNVESTEDFNLRLTAAAKKAAPSTLGDWVGSKVTGLFSGRSAEEMEDEAALAIAEGPLAQNNKALNIFMQRYNETKDAGRAFDFTKMVLPEIDPDDTKTITERVEIKGSADTGFYAITIQEKKDEFTGNVTSKAVGSVKQINADDDTGQSLLLKSLKSNLNFAKDPLDQLYPDQYVKFAKQAEAAAGVPLQAITTLDQYIKVAGVYSAFIQENPAALKDKFRDDMVIAGLDILVTVGDKVAAIKASTETDPVKKQILLNGVSNNIMQAGETLNQAVRRTSFNDL